MAQSLPFRLRLTHIRNETPARCCRLSRRNASTYTGLTELSEDVEGSSSLAVPAPSPGEVQDFNPLKRAQDRPVPLPPSRFVFILIRDGYLPVKPRLNAWLIESLDIVRNHLDIAAALSIHDNLPKHPIHHHENSFLAHSQSHASNKPTSQLLPPIS